MRQFPALLAIVATTTFAVVPHPFSSGKPAVAQDVNENFAALDTAIQNRATKADLATKADTSKTNPVSRKVDALASSKQDALGFAPVKRTGDTISGTLSVAGGGYFGQPDGVPISANVLLSAYAPKNFANMYLHGAGAGYVAKSANGEWSFGTRDDGLGRSSAGSWVINDASEARLWGDKASTNILTPLIVSGATTVSGNLAVTGSGVFGSIPPAFNVDPVQISGNITMQSMTGAADSLAIQFKGGKSYESGSMTILAATDGTKTLSLNIMNSGSKNLFSISNDDGSARFFGTITTGAGTQIPDYVFEPDYKLAPLSEVEAFTQANKHLPEVPSAADMTSNGVDLAKMNMILLKKVEELTLHAIAQEKRLDAQQKLIEELRDSR